MEESTREEREGSEARAEGTADNLQSWMVTLTRVSCKMRIVASNGSISSVCNVLCRDGQALNKLKRFVRKGDLENTDE